MRYIFETTTPLNREVMASAGEIMVMEDDRGDWEGLALKR